MVTQDTSLLHRSVRDNILYGRPDATEAELVDAARQANADGFIQELVDAADRLQVLQPGLLRHARVTASASRR